MLGGRYSDGRCWHHSDDIEALNARAESAQRKAAAGQRVRRRNEQLRAQHTERKSFNPPVTAAELMALTYAEVRTIRAVCGVLMSL